MGNAIERRGNDLVVSAPGPLRGTGSVPGDKSVSHRVLLAGALVSGRLEVFNLSPCADVAVSRACVEALGVRVEATGDNAVVVWGRGPTGLAGAPARLGCGRSGTTLRLLAGVLAGQERDFILDGDEQLRARPMDRLVDPLTALGARIDAPGGHPPVTGRGGGLKGATVPLRRASAQVGSAVVLAALNARGTTTVVYPAPVRDHTEALLARLRAPVTRAGCTTRVTGPVTSLAPPPGGLRVPGDISAAAYLLAAGALVEASAVTVTGVGLNPGRTGFLRIMTAMGARLEIRPDPADLWEPTGTVAVASGPLEATEVDGPRVPQAIDELPLVAVLATQARGVTRVTGAQELRVKESDRIAAIVTGLRRLGADIRAAPDGFVVRGPTPLVGTAVSGQADHRIVMALAVAGLVAKGVTRVLGASYVDDSFPGFEAAVNDLAAASAPAGA